MTKLTWDNAVFVSTNTARRLGLENQERVEVRLRGKSVEASVWILPGHPDDSLTVDLGWGRTHAGRAGDGAGFNAYLLRVSDAMWHGSDVELRKLGKTLSTRDNTDAAGDGGSGHRHSQHSGRVQESS